MAMTTTVAVYDKLEHGFDGGVNQMLFMFSMHQRSWDLEGGV
jgi:hypothetical protein